MRTCQSLSPPHHAPRLLPRLDFPDVELTAARVEPQGNLHARVDLRKERQQEFLSLANSFNGMAAQVEHLEGTAAQKSRAYSPAVITQGGKTVWLAGQTTTTDRSGNTARSCRHTTAAVHGAS